MNCYDDLNDRQLLQRFVQQRDEEAFRALVSRHGPMVLRVSRSIMQSHHDAEEVLQAAFLVLAKKAKKVAWHESVANWLYGVAWRIARRESKRTRLLSRPSVTPSATPPEELPSPTPAEISDAEELLYPALYQLPNKYRAPIILCYLEGKSRKQAAEELKLTESTVKGRLERGRELLRGKLQGNVSAPLNCLGSGMIAQQVLTSQITPRMERSMTEACLQFAAHSTSSSSTAISVQLARGEILQMNMLMQLKLGVCIVGTLLVGGAAAVLAPQSGSQPPAAERPAAAVPTVNATPGDVTTKRHLQAIMHAVHAYVEDHNGLLPPAVVPNPNLPPEKRLSGLVLLLPYLGIRPSSVDNNQWQNWHADNARAKRIYELVKLDKAWDDPANLEAAKSIVPEFLSPETATQRNPQGLAVTHFAFVRGSKSRDNGMFPLGADQPLAIPDINDGTSNTMAVGQISTELGPWIAAGSSTARFVNIEATAAGFGSETPGAAWFANGDGFTYLLDLSATDPGVLVAMAGRSDATVVNMKRVVRYQTKKQLQEMRAK